MTELGPIPVDWEVKRLGECGSFSKGAGISKAQANSGRIPAVRYGELYTTHHDYIKAFESFISDEVAKESTRLTYGDIVFACSGETKEEIGKCAAFLGNETAYAGGDLIIFSPNGEYDSKFLAFELNMPICVSQKAAAGQGDAVVHIRRESLENLCVLIPPLAEQRRIAGALSDVDELISALGKLIEKKRNIKTGAMQQLLTGKTRLPGFGADSLSNNHSHTEVSRGRGFEFKQTELGPIPVDWEVKRLGEIAEICTGKRNGDEQVENGIYPFFVRSSSVYRINTFSYEGEAILIPGEGGIGDIFHYINGRFDFHQRVYKVSDFATDICAKYIYYCMRMFFSGWAHSQTVKAAVDSLRLPTFELFQVRIPPTLAEQKAIAAVLSDMDAEIAALEADRAKYERIKSGMMQELLTGRTRLKGE